MDILKSSCNLDQVAELELRDAEISRNIATLLPTFFLNGYVGMSKYQLQGMNGLTHPNAMKQTYSIHR